MQYMSTTRQNSDIETHIKEPENLEEYWYRTPGTVKHRFWGVFEGGGAKGVAYCGALLAMKEKRCWFNAVAGASSGAITAALIASGMSPEEMETVIEKGLQQVTTSIWAGFRRLRSDTGYFPSDKLREWLENILKTQLRKSGIVLTEKVNFRELYNASGIELNVVAADCR